MKNVNVLLAVVLCAGLCVLFGLFNRSTDESSAWSPNEIYMHTISSGEGSSFTSANLSGGNVSNDGVAVSMRNGSFSLRTRARYASSPGSLVASGVPGKSADFWGALSPNSPIASSPNSLIGHMTSSAEYHSFGGGSNMTMGSYASSSNNLIASSPAIGSYRPSPSSPIALSPNSLITSSPNNLIAYSPSNGEVQVAAEQALMSASSSANGLFGSALQTTYGTASYDQTIYGSYGSAPSGVRGRKNVGAYTPNVEDTWLIWLSQHIDDFGISGEGGWYYNESQLRAAWAAYCEAWNETMGKKPTWDEWLAWFMGNDGSHTWGSGEDAFNAYFVPVGNILPLVLMAMLYMIILFVKRNKTAQL